jgi:hypothetical protein
MRKSDYDKALTNYEYVIQKSWNPFEITALQNAADIYYRKENYVQSLSNYTLLQQKSTIPSQQTDALLGMTRSSYFNKDYSKAITLSEMLLKEPKLSNEQKDEAHLIMARSTLELNDLNKANQEYKLLSKSSKSDYVSEALYHIAYITYKQDNLLEAEKKIFEILTNISTITGWQKVIFYGGYLFAKRKFLPSQAYLHEHYRKLRGEDLRLIASEKYNAIIAQEEALEKQRKEEMIKTEEQNTPETIE